MPLCGNSTAVNCWNHITFNWLWNLKVYFLQKHMCNVWIYYLHPAIILILLIYNVWLASLIPVLFARNMFSVCSLQLCMFLFLMHICVICLPSGLLLWISAAIQFLCIFYYPSCCNDAANYCWLICKIWNLFLFREQSMLSFGLLDLYVECWHGHHSDPGNGNGSLWSLLLRPITNDSVTASW